MKINDEYKNNFVEINKVPVNSPLSTDNIISVYTATAILLEIKKSLGLEAMIEYMEKYLLLIESKNPRLKFAVGQAIRLINVDKFYRDLMIHETKEEAC